MLRLRSNGPFMRQPLVRLPVLFVLYLSLWLGAELAAFAAVVHLIGFFGAIAACILTSLAGLATLRAGGDYPPHCGCAGRWLRAQRTPVFCRKKRC